MFSVLLAFWNSAASRLRPEPAILSKAIHCVTGFSILLLDTEPRTHNHYLILAIADALRRHPAVARIRVAGHGDALSAFSDEGCDTLIAFGGANTHAPIIGRLAALARTSVLWTTEDPYELVSNVRSSTGFDFVFTNDRASVPAYGGRARHLPLAASSLFHELDVLAHDRSYRYDLLFVGTAWPNRVESVNRLLAGLPKGLKVKLALPFNEYLDPPALEDVSLITDWRCGNRDFARLANLSRVVLTLPRVFSAARADQATGSTPPPRLFETALAGGYQVVVSSEAEILDYYAADSQIAFCENESAATEAIAAALAAPDRRIAAARAAQARTRNEHLYDHRVAEILSAVAGRRSAPMPALEASQGNRTVLMLTHNRTGYRPGGGVEVYQELLTELSQNISVLFLFPVLDDGRCLLHLEGSDFKEIYDCGSLGLPKLTDPYVEGVFERILFEQRVDLVHIHHLLHLPLSLPLISRACGVPVIYHLHDHYLICERWLLLDHAGRFCDVVNRGSGQCDACMIAASNYPPGAKARRDAFAARVARAIDAFVTSTPGTGEYVRSFFPEIAAERIVEIEMVAPEAIGPARESPFRHNLLRRDRLTVAVLGNFSAHKGASDVIELIRTCEGYPIHFKLIGSSDAHHHGRLLGLPPDQITITGSYEQHMVGALLAGCDVSLHLSIWPETFVIALTEAWRAGLVPIVTALGALAERVSDGVDGFIVPPHDPGAVRARLMQLLLEAGLLTQMRTAISKKRFISVENHLASMRGLYERLMAARPCPHERIPDRLRTGYHLKLEDLNLRVNAGSWVDGAILWDETSKRPGPVSISGKPDQPILFEVPEVLREGPITPLAPRFAQWFLDAFHTDDRPVSQAHLPLVRRSLFLRGWLRTAGMTPLKTYLRLTGPSGSAWALLSPDPRADVAEHVKDPSASAAGFMGKIDVGGLGFGFHALALVQVSHDRKLAWEGLPPVFAAPDREAVVRFLPEIRPLAVAGTDLVGVVKQSLLEAGGVALASAHSLWAFEIATAGPWPDTADEPLALLQDDAGRVWSVPATRIDERAARFNARLPELDIGPCTCVLALPTASGLRPLTRPFSIEIVPDGQLFRMSDTLPNGVSARFPRKERQPPIFDSVAREGDGANAFVRMKGWALVPKLGAPSCTLAVWQEETLRACISAGLHRVDVATDRGFPATMACGFELAVPETVLARGNVRFLQSYAGQTVQYTTFTKAVRLASDLFQETS